jgi:restriction endonuclease S subunit
MNHPDKEELERFLVPVLPMDTQQKIAEEFSRMSRHHDLAMDAAGKEITAHEHQNRAAAERYHAEYERNIAMAEAMLNDLIRQVEEIIEGKRTEIEPVERILKEAQGSGA